MAQKPSENKAASPADKKKAPNENPEEATKAMKTLETLILAAHSLKQTIPQNAESLKAALASQPEHRSALNSRENEQLIRDFYSAEGFVKRLQLHMMFICKSKTKQQTSLSLYFAQLRQQDKTLNLIDYQPCEGNKDAAYDKKKPEEVLNYWTETQRKKL